jgi:hypothetical protein
MRRNTMDFGTIFIALIGFTIAMLLLPQYLESTIENNIDLLKEDLRENQDISSLGIDRDTPEFKQANALWKLLTHEERARKIKRIKRQKYVPYVTVLIVFELILFSYSSYKIARGQRMPGFIEDVVIGLSIMLIFLTIYTASRVIKRNRAFSDYLSAYEEYTERFSTSGKS